MDQSQIASCFALVAGQTDGLKISSRASASSDMYGRGKIDPVQAGLVALH
jgi:hypothetical protein